jgi:hypothetical protein
MSGAVPERPPSPEKRLVSPRPVRLVSPRSTIAPPQRHLSAVNEKLREQLRRHGHDAHA